MVQPRRTTILWDNQGTPLSFSSTDSNYPSTNLDDDAVSIPARTTGDTGGKRWGMNISGKSVNTFALGGHNFSSSGTFKIYRGNNAIANIASFTDVTMTPNHFIYYWDSVVAKTYVIFYSSEDTSEGYHEIGEMWAGKRYELPFNPQIPISLLNNEEIGQLLTSGGQKWSYIEKRQKGYSMNFIEDVTPAMYASLEEIYEDRGTSKPFFIHLKPTDCGDPYSYDPVMCVHTTEFAFSIDGKDKRVGTWSVEEEL